MLPLVLGQLLTLLLLCCLRMLALALPCSCCSVCRRREFSRTCSFVVLLLLRMLALAMCLSRRIALF